MLGFDGGMNQTFHIIVKELDTSIIKFDDSSLTKVKDSDKKFHFNLFLMFFLFTRDSLELA